MRLGGDPGAMAAAGHGVATSRLGQRFGWNRRTGTGAELDDEVPAAEASSSRRWSWSRRYVLACSIFASLNSVLLGYDVGVMSGCIIFIQRDLHITEVQQEVLVGCLSVISIVGSLAAGSTSDAVGRKWTIGLSAVVFQVGAAVMALAPSFQALMLGRLLAGVGIGCGAVVTPLYIAEISPAISRGTLTSFPEIFINLGILLGYISNYVFSDLSEHINWRIMLGVGVLPSIFIGFALFVIPESPRWLVVQKRVDEARTVLLRINENEEEAEQRLAEILAAAGGASEERSVWPELLRPSPALRRMLIAGVGIQCFQQLTGIDATVYYSPRIFKHAGMDSDGKLLAATVAVGLTKTLFMLVAIALIDKAGRKPLLYISTVGLTVCLIILGVALSLLEHEMISGHAAATIAVFAVCGNVAFFAIGMGPVSWVVSSEIYPLRLRAQAAAIGAGGNRVSSGLVGTTFLSLCRAFTMAGTFLMFSVISMLSVIFICMCVPETKGTTLEQIEMLFVSGKEWQKSEVQLSDVEPLMQE